MTLSQNRMSIVKLPDDVLLDILHHLSRRDLLNARLVCRRLWELGSNRSALKIRFAKYKNAIKLQKLHRLLKCASILKNVSTLALAKSKEENMLTLLKHLQPISSNFSHLRELLLFDVTVEKKIRIAHLPPSLHSLKLSGVTFESDVRFFSSKNKDSIPKLKELCICSSTKLSSFELLCCFYSLIKLALKEFDFGELDFTQLKGNFPLLETLEIAMEATNYDALPVMEVIGTFKMLKHLSIFVHDCVINGFKYLSGCDKLVTIDIFCLEISDEEDFSPTFPSLKSASFFFASFENKFCRNFCNMFPVLTELYLNLVASCELGNMNLSTFVALTSHPTLTTLHLNCIAFMPRERIGRSTVPPASCVTKLSLYDSAISYNGARFIGKYFSNVIEFYVSHDFGNDNFHYGEIVRWMKKLKKVL